MSMQGLQLANIPIGDPVLISFGKDVQFVKTAWPGKGNKDALLSVALTKEGKLFRRYFVLLICLFSGIC